MPKGIDIAVFVAVSARTRVYGVALSCACRLYDLACIVMSMSRGKAYDRRPVFLSVRNGIKLKLIALSGFEIYSGFDDQFLYNAAAGGVGSIGGLANVVPDIWSDLIRAYNGGSLSRTVALSRLIDRLMPVYEMGSSCSLLFKKLLVHRGVEIDPKAIFPFNEADNAAFETVREILDSVLADYATLKV